MTDVHVTLKSIGAGAGSSGGADMVNMTLMEKARMKHPKGFRQPRKRR